MRQLSPVLLVMPLLGGLMTPVTTAAALAATPYCRSGEAPTYHYGFKALSDALGDRMGTPLSCEYGDPKGTGDTEQDTAKGLAFFRKSTNTPTFTDGFNHWALTSSGLVTWTGGSIDPPGTSSSRSAAPSSNASSNFAPFVGTWGGHGRQLDVQSNGIAVLTYRNYGCPINTCDDFTELLQFTSASLANASGNVLSSNDPDVPSRASVTLSLASDTVELFIDGRDFANFCGAKAQMGACGA